MSTSRETVFTAIAAATLLAAFSNTAAGASFNVQPFATGAAVGGTSPDSVLFGDGSVWIAYQNGADSAGASGSSTVVRYTPAGKVLNTWSIAGNVDGLRVDPTGLIWAMQNNDGNSALTVINPLTNATTPYSYGTSYTANGNSAGRGFDDAAFTKGQVFLSETNPGSGTDPVVVRLTTGLTSPLQIAGVLNSTLTGTNLATGAQASTTITDSDSLILTPTGTLALTGEADQTIVFIQNPGAANQTESFIALLGTNGQPLSGNPDDTMYPTATQGFFYIADTGANTVYRITATGLTAGSVYINDGHEFGSLDTTTGIITPIFTGVSPHGGEFVTFADAGVPEPASLYSAAAGLAFCGAIGYWRRRRKA
ncbi:MAG: hypothetical protein JO051_12700 [Acidobacteriaceae bacterium]|nr:hypothetical protein [Acidobacteriaceae bacterium]